MVHGESVVVAGIWSWLRDCWRRHWLAWIVVALATVSYLCLAPSHLMGGDNGEFVALARVGGVAHPPGYPLYTLMLRALHGLPGTPAHAAAQATALLGGLQILLLVLSLRAWGASAVSAAFAAAVYAASSLALLLNSYAEVFCLNGLIAAGLLLVCAPEPPWHGRRRLLALSVLWACGLANHHSIVLLAPLLFVGVVSAARESPSRWRSLGFSVLLFCLLFSAFYGSLLLAPRLSAPHAFVWGDGGSLSWLIDHFLRKHYGTFRLASSDNPYDYGAQLRFFFSSVARSWWVLLVLIPWGIAAGWRRSWVAHAGVERFCWPALCASWLLSGPVFFLGFNFNTGASFGREVVQRFHLLPILLLTPAVAVGLDACAAKVRSLAWHGQWRLTRASMGAPLSPVIRACLAAVAVVYSFALCLVLAWPQLSPLRSRVLDRALRNTLNGLPANAVLLVVGDSQSFGYLALQQAEGLRPDVTVIWRLLLGKSWYRRQLPAALVQPAPVSPSGANQRNRPALEQQRGYQRQQLLLIERALAQGRPVFVDPQFGLQRSRTWYGAYRSVPFGAYRRLLAPQQSEPTPAQVYAWNRALFLGYDLSGMDEDHDSAGHEFVGRYLVTWAVIERMLKQQGEERLARQAAAFRDRFFFPSP